MEQFTPLSEADQLYFAPNQVAKVIFWLLFLLCGCIGIALPIIKIDITINAVGIIRPSQERTEIKSIQEGVITNINFKNGDLVRKGELLLELNADPLVKRSTLSLFNESILSDQIADLQLLCKYPFEQLLPEKLKTEIYVEQLQRVKQEIVQKNAIIEKLYNELRRDSLLFVDKVISKKEFDDKYAEWLHALHDKQIKIKEQLSAWNSEWQRLMINLNNTGAETVSINSQVKRSKVYAPITGYIQTSTIRYLGSMIMAGESICMISPSTSLIAECFVTPKDIGMLKPNLPATIYVDAFDYRHFGFLQTRLDFIEPDISINDNKQGFKVRCSLPVETLQLKNGYRAKITRGQTIQARFVVARRTVWQLLFDSINDWLKPY